VSATSRTSSASAIALWVLAVLATVFFLRSAKALLIPIVLAVLISYALEPIVAWLERHRLPRLAGTALVLLTILASAAVGMYAVRDDARQLVDVLPRAADRAREMIVTQLGISADVIEEAAGNVGTGGEATSSSQGESPPNDVPGSLLQRAAGGVLALAGHLTVIFFLVFFLLFSGHHVRRRLVEIAGPDIEGRRTMATIIVEINRQIERYLLVLLVTGTVVGLSTWVVLAWMDVRHAALWGLLAGVFNSIPYFGPVILAGGLFVVGLVQDGGMAQALQMAGAAIIITSLEGWLLTPPLMGRVERMSALAVFLGLLLWTWIWGAWGTVLAVPMLVILKSVADHVEGLRPVGRLMAP
jgi:predicted PurR-regulated permease PerM